MKHVEDSNKHIIEEIVCQVVQLPEKAKTVFTKLEETLPSKPSDWGKETISCGVVKRVRIFQHFNEQTILLPNFVTGH